MTKVTAVSRTINDIMNDEIYWKKPSLREYSEADKFFQIKFIASSDNENLALKRLNEVGLLQYPPQSPQKIKDDLMNHLKKYFEIGDKT